MNYYCHSPLMSQLNRSGNDVEDYGIDMYVVFQSIAFKTET